MALQFRRVVTGHDETGRDVGGRRRSGRVDPERGAHGHARRSHVGPEVALRGGAANGRRGMPREPYVAISSDPNRGRAKPSHRDAGFMQGRHTRQNRCAERGGRGRCERAS